MLNTHSRMSQRRRPQMSPAQEAVARQSAAQGRGLHERERRARDDGDIAARGNRRAQDLAVGAQGLPRLPGPGHLGYGHAADRWHGQRARVREPVRHGHGRGRAGDASEVVTVGLLLLLLLRPYAFFGGWTCCCCCCTYRFPLSPGWGLLLSCLFRHPCRLPDDDDDDTTDHTPCHYARFGLHTGAPELRGVLFLLRRSSSSSSVWATTTTIRGEKREGEQN